MQIQRIQFGIQLVLKELRLFFSTYFVPVSGVLDMENKWKNYKRKKLLFNADEGVDCVVW